MSKLRRASIVVHNLEPSVRENLFKGIFNLGCEKILYSMERYADNSPGQHIHCFLAFKNPRSKKRLLSDLKLLTQCYIKTGDKEGQYGRIQVDPMRGSFNDAYKYLTNPDKDKFVDPQGCLFHGFTPPRREPITFTCEECQTRRQIIHDTCHDLWLDALIDTGIPMPIRQGYNLL